MGYTLMWKSSSRSVEKEGLKMPWRKVTPVSERLDLCKLADEKRYSISELARSFNVSRKTVYKWLDRYSKEGDKGIFDRSRRPVNTPKAIGEDIVGEVIKLKQDYPDWGPRKLHKLLVDKHGLVCSRSSVERILSRAGLANTRESAVPVDAVGRFERSEPNDLWQIDFTAAFALSDGSKVWPVPILDDSCRYCACLMAAPACSARYALDCVRAAALSYGMPAQILSDHGSAFGTSRRYVSEFTAYLWACGIEHIQGRYAHPQTQGKLERFNRTLRIECIGRHSYDSIEDWNKCFEEYRYIYNNIRPHQSLSDSTPASRYRASERVFVEPERGYMEPGDENTRYRKVGSDGKIWLLQHHVKVGRGLAGWIVSAKHDGCGYWTISFRNHSICQVSLAKEAIYKPRP
jgi:transposase InsO family protein